MLNWFDEEEKERKDYLESLGEEIGYSGEECINCGRITVIKYSTGKKICEKCSFDQDKKDYDYNYNKYL